MENLVYWFTFESRLKARTPPYFYIGSKTNAKFENGVIIDKYRKEYWSSCYQKRYLDALNEEFPSVHILYYGKDSLDIEEKLHIKWNVVKSDNFFNKSQAKGTFKSSIKGIPKSREHRLKMKESSHLRGLKPWEHPHTLKRKAHLYWLNSEKYYDWYFGPHTHSRVGPVLMSRETGLECTSSTGNCIINMFKNGWNPYIDLEFQKFKNNCIM